MPLHPTNKRDPSKKIHFSASTRKKKRRSIRNSGSQGLPPAPGMEELELPCLAFHQCGHSTQLFTTSEHKRIAAGEDMDEILTGKVVCPTAQGHLLVRDPATLSTFLWNPRNGGKIHLPPLHGMEDRVLMHSHCLLSDEPASPGCVVLVVEPDDDFIWYVHPGDDEWVEHGYDIGEPAVLDYDDEDEPKLICPIAACRGKFYFNSLETELGVLEFFPDDGPVFSSIEIDDAIAADGSYGYGEEYRRGTAGIHLVESGGELYMVTLLCPLSARAEIYRAGVHRMDFADRRWRKVDSLGGRVFLVSPFYSGASCFGGDHGSLRQDCVYIVYHKTLVGFDVKENTIETQKLDGVPDSDKAFWMIPTK